ncbi:MAG: DUF2911 domain-containing protein [Acidobacteria bacterium]|nr:DUF2911 domain-containing protein [Acidobacteriota bacterium]
MGLTEITVTYNRPAVKGRKVWGGLVPHGEPWRAGANENTVVAFSTPVKVGNATLAAGRYGLHMIPGPSTWTVAFSRQSHLWGSYGYDPKEDAVRLAVTPVGTEPTERLAFTFDDPGEAGVTLSLRWERLRVPIPIGVDTKQVVVASLREQLGGLHQFFAASWIAAAGWCLKQEVNLDEALTWTDRALAMRESYPALSVKAGLLEKKGDQAGAQALRSRALAVANEAEVNQAGYELLARKKVDEAIALFQKNVQNHPGSWNAHDSLGEAFALKGDKERAAFWYRKALEMVKQEEQRKRIQAELAKLQ